MARLARVREQVAELRDVGVQHLLCQTGFGAMSHEQNIASMRRFGEQVMPAFRRRYGEERRMILGVLGLSLPTFTLLHVLLSVVGIAAGLIVMERLLRNRALGLSNTIFLVATILTSASGFLFPSRRADFTPAQTLGVISLADAGGRRAGALCRQPDRRLALDLRRARR